MNFPYGGFYPSWRQTTSQKKVAFGKPQIDFYYSLSKTLCFVHSTEFNPYFSSNWGMNILSEDNQCTKWTHPEKYGLFFPGFFPSFPVLFTLFVAYKYCCKHQNILCNIQGDKTTLNVVHLQTFQPKLWRSPRWYTTLFQRPSNVHNVHFIVRWALKQRCVPVGREFTWNVLCKPRKEGSLQWKEHSCS